MLRRLLALAALTALVAVVVMTVAPGVALAGPDADRTAARHFAEGQKAFSAGDYPHAGDEFEAAYRDKPHYAPLWNAGRSWQRAGDEIRAANVFAHYLREAPPDAPDRDQATAALRTLTARLGRIELHAAGVDRLRIDGKNVEAPVIYVAPGEHVAEADDKSAPVRKVVAVRAGEQVSITLAPNPKLEPVIGPRRVDDASEASRSGKPLPPAVPIVGAALTLVAGGLTVASGLDTISRRDSFPDDRTQARLDDARASQTRTNVLIGTTIGVGVLTGVLALVFTEWSRAPTNSPEVGVR